jgi:hypothetical protein
MLAAVWQLLRLGVMRTQGRPVIEPEPPPAAWPDRWDQLPAVTRLEPRARPFCGYQTLSILSPRFLLVEAAVRTILSQVHVDPPLAEQLAAKAEHEGLHLPTEIVDRVSYVLAGDSESNTGCLE